MAAFPPASFISVPTKYSWLAKVELWDRFAGETFIALFLGQPEVRSGRACDNLQMTVIPGRINALSRSLIDGVKEKSVMSSAASLPQMPGDSLEMVRRN